MSLQSLSAVKSDSLAVRHGDLFEGTVRIPSRGTPTPPPDVLTILWQRRWGIAATVAAGLALAILYLLVATPIYTATARIEVMLGLPQLGGGGDTEARAKNFLNTQCQLMGSAVVLERVVQRPDVRQMRTFAGVPDAFEALKKRLAIDPGSKDDLITISLESVDAAEASRVVNLIVEAYVAHQQMRTHSAAAEMLKVLQREKEQRAVELAQLRQQMLKHKDENAVLSFVDERGNVTLQRLAQLSEAMTAAQVETMRAAAAYDAAKLIVADRSRGSGLANSLMAVLPEHAQRDQALANVREELLRIEVQAKSLEARLGSNHPSLAVVSRTVNELRDKLATTTLGLLEQARGIAAAKERPVVDAFNAQKREALELNSVAVKHAVLEGDVQQAQKVVDALDARVTELRMAGDGGGLTVNVLDPARTALTPTSPRKPIVLGGALLGSLFVGACVAFLRGVTDQRVYTNHDVAAALPVRILCGVPSVTGSGEAGRIRRALQVHLEPASHASEVYRVIRTAIQLGSGGPTKTLLVTSPDKGDGKSTVASNLAIALAQAGERVLLVDADLRAPVVHELLRVPGDIGIISVLRREERLKDAIQETAFPRLDVLPCGPIPPNPSEVINTQRFNDMLRAIATHYDRVIFDAPPARLADPLILASRCDATLLVVRAGRSTGPACGAAYAALHGVRARILGVVVNDVSAKSSFYDTGEYGYGHAPAAPRTLEALPGVDDFDRFRQAEVAPAAVDTAMGDEATDYAYRASGGNGHATGGKGRTMGGNGYATDGNGYATGGHAAGGNGHATNGNGHAPSGNGHASGGGYASSDGHTSNGNGQATSDHATGGNGHAGDNGHANGGAHPVAHDPVVGAIVTPEPPGATTGFRHGADVEQSVGLTTEMKDDLVRPDASLGAQSVQTTFEVPAVDSGEGSEKAHVVST